VGVVLMHKLTDEEIKIGIIVGWVVTIMLIVGIGIGVGLLIKFLLGVIF
jgi:hypothetical protein